MTLLLGAAWRLAWPLAVLALVYAGCCCALDCGSCPPAEPARADSTPAAKALRRCCCGRHCRCCGCCPGQHHHAKGAP